MKIIKQKNRATKITLIVLAILIFCAGGYVLFAKQHNTWPFNQKTHSQETTKGGDVNYKTPTNDQNSEGKRIKERSVDPKNQPPQPSPSDTKKTVAATVTAANQNNGKLQIRFLIQALDKGTCTLQLTRGTTTVTRQSPTQTLPSSMTCQGFDIAVSDLSAGEWAYTMTYTGTETTASVKDKVTI